METRTLIKDSATVARVTQLEEGDAYRRLIPKTTYQGARMVVGVVTSVLNNGETVAITALEVKEDSNRYSADSPVEVKIFEADADLALFPVVEGEVQEILALAREEMGKRVLMKQKELADAQDHQDRLEHVAGLVELAQRVDATETARQLEEGR